MKSNVLARLKCTHCTMDDEGLVVAGGDGETEDLSQLDGTLLPHRVATVKAVEMEVTEDVDTWVSLHGSVELDNMGRVHPGRVQIDVHEPADL